MLIHVRIVSTLLVAAAVTLFAGCSADEGPDIAAEQAEAEARDARMSSLMSSLTNPSRTFEWEDEMSSRSSSRAAEEAAEREEDEALERLFSDPEPTSVPLADEDAVNDASFVSTLDMLGVHYSSTEGAIRLAKTVCSNFESGMDGLTSTMAIVASGMYTSQQAGAMVGAATAIYCPEYEHLIPG
ncbi:UNVERIFIED_ORG: uncharacterized protein DUF732 [Dietzia maris]